MPVAVSRSDGVTVLTITSDQSSICPPLCQLLGSLCYTPGLCSVSRSLPPQRGGPQAALGALWIITGLLHIGLGTVVICAGSSPSYRLQDTYCPVWLGLLFMFIGVCCVLSERYPRPIFVLLCGILNLFGTAMSITAIVWYATLLDNVGFYELCWSEDYDYWNTPSTTLSPENKPLLERCQEAKLLLRTFSISLSTTLVTLSAVDACLGLSSAIIGFKSLRRRGSESRNKPLLQKAKATTQEEE